MAKYYETSSVFNFTWDQVAQAYWQRYPNPQRFVEMILLFKKKKNLKCKNHIN